MIVRAGQEGRTERKDTMTFVYPAVFTPKKDGKGYDAYFPDLECCEAEGPDLEDAVENARDAAYNWISLELDIPIARNVYCGACTCRSVSPGIIRHSP